MLLSINPEYVDRIFNGSKRFEFRKTKNRKEVDTIVIYETAPVMKVVGEAQVQCILLDTPNAIWDKTSSHSGISKDFFDSYFKGRDCAVAYKLGEVTKYECPVSLLDLGIRSAPQSFIYLS
jgi:predicted transcriptional regulator